VEAGSPVVSKNVVGFRAVEVTFLPAAPRPAYLVALPAMSFSHEPCLLQQVAAG
jgi:hypothetical protein